MFLFMIIFVWVYFLYVVIAERIYLKGKVNFKIYLSAPFVHLHVKDREMGYFLKATNLLYMIIFLLIFYI